MDPNSKIDEPDSRGGRPALLRALAVLAVIAAAIMMVFTVLDVIPLEELSDWGIRAGLIVLIVAAAAVAIATLARGGR
ncbi:MAG: hypothetical protein N2653_10155 [Burkholderiales bacterium]|nr:hypothetical protein [Burkholderiales bacterium]